MYKSLAAVSAALAILSLGPMVSAQAGGATSAPSKYNRQIASSYQARDHRLAQTVDFRITEFSSSSAKNSVAKR